VSCSRSKTLPSTALDITAELIEALFTIRACRNTRTDLAEKNGRSLSIINPKALAARDYPPEM